MFSSENVSFNTVSEWPQKFRNRIRNSISEPHIPNLFFWMQNQPERCSRLCRPAAASRLERESSIGESLIACASDLHGDDRSGLSGKTTCPKVKARTSASENSDDRLLCAAYRKRNTDVAGGRLCHRQF